MRKTKTLIVVFYILLSCEIYSQNFYSTDSISKERVEGSGERFLVNNLILSHRNSSDIEEAVLGALIYLKNKQVGNKRYKVNYNDFKTVKIPKYNFIGALRSFVSNHLVKDKHRENLWPSFVIFQPNKKYNVFQPTLITPDYNLFTTASTAYPLFFINDKQLASHSQFVTKMRTKAVESFQKFRRGSSFNFWPVKNRVEYSYSYSGPDNIPLSFISFLYKLNNKTGLVNYGMHESELLIEWLDEINDDEKNKDGLVALFNIPNDSDDTSMALVLSLLSEMNDLTNMAIIDSVDKQVFSTYRDIERNKFDRYNELLPKNTGAFLTWHKNDSSEDFSKPEKGIIPLKVNNIDLSVNANTLHFLSRAGLSDLPGFRETALLLADAIKSNKWYNASLYYPERLWFPYTLSRAIRDGRLNVPEINETLPCFISSIIELQQNFELQNSSLKGAFPAFNSVSYNLSTALGLNTLLNLGRENACKAGKQDVFDSVVNNSIRFLLMSQKKSAKPDKTFGVKETFWLSGPLFSSSIQDMAHWYSNSQNTGLVLEALTKYLLGYDMINNPEKINIRFVNNRLTIK